MGDTVGDKRKDTKESVRAATTAALATNTLSGGKITASGNGALGALDGITLAVGEHLLVQDEVAGANNGVYVISDAGSGSTPFIMTRRDDFNSSAKVSSGASVFCSEGTLNAGITFQITTADPITLDTTSLTFADAGAATLHAAGDGSDHADVATNTTHISSDGTDHSDVVLNTTHLSSDGSDHSDVVLNTTHLSSDGTDHSDVVLNTTHLSSDGSDHSDVVVNSTHVAGDGSDHADVATNTATVAVLSVEETDDTLQAKRIARGVWDHASGLTTGSSPYAFGPTLPDNAIPVRAWYQVVTTFTSSGSAAVIGLGIPTDDADGIVAAIDIADGGTPWAAGNHEGIQTGTVANFGVQLTAARQFEGTLTTENTTAGKLILFVEYVVAE